MIQPIPIFCEVLAMRTLRTVVAVVLVLVLAASASAAGGKAGKKGKKAAKAVHGVVAAVVTDKDKSNTGTVTVTVRHGKKKAGNVTKTEKKFTVGESTKVEKVSGKKGKLTTTAVTLGDLKEGTKVVITAKGDTADEIKFRVKKGKKAKAS
jgi:hypothetical protein